MPVQERLLQGEESKPQVRKRLLQGQERLLEVQERLLQFGFLPLTPSRGGHWVASRFGGKCRIADGGILTDRRTTAFAG